MDPLLNQKAEPAPEQEALTHSGTIQPLTTLTLAELQAPANPPAPVPQEPQVNEAPLAPKQHVPFVPDPNILPPVKDDKNIAGIILGSILTLVIISGGLFGWYYFNNIYVSNDDYKAAVSQIQTASNTQTLAEVAGPINDEKIDYINNSYNAFKQKNTELDSVRALKVDKDINSKYEAYKKQTAAFVIFMDKALPSLIVCTKASNEAQALNADGTPFTSAKVQKIITIYESAGDIPDPSMKAGMGSMIAVYKELLAATQIAESKKASNAAKLAAVVNVRDNIVPKLETDLGAMATNFKKQLEAVSPVQAQRELTEAITAKYSKA
ncbi:MAG: hypothetical protein JWO54_417 [Candidatus Saccharibacteria bacterium]|nr:hypothetical protein [Candidatus Saccharibacteria bacterium]MDB5180657.1 hypothetical protein [Candidatus Saccharibacteria bacterium]